MLKPVIILMVSGHLNNERLKREQLGLAVLGLVLISGISLFEDVGLYLCQRFCTEDSSSAFSASYPEHRNQA